MQPFSALPQQFYVCWVADIGLITSCVAHATAQVAHPGLPMPGQYRLGLFYGEVFSHEAAGFTDNIFVFDLFALAQADTTK